MRPDPRKVITSGPNSDIGEKDPLPILNAELSQFRVATIPGLVVPPLIGMPWWLEFQDGLQMLTQLV